MTTFTKVTDLRCPECAEGLGFDEARHSCGERHPDHDVDDRPVEYCDYCEVEGHTFRACPRRDDEAGQ
jgi:hypothetical protein